MGERKGFLGRFAGFFPYIALRKHVLQNRPLLAFRKSKPHEVGLPIPALCLINFKGGVGKTTIAANLAAAFAEHCGLRILLVDLDYQGSLSAMMTGRSDAPNLTSEWLKRRELTANSLENEPVDASGVPKVKVVTCTYDLTEIEDNLLIRWLMHMNAGGDVRTILLRKLKKLPLDQYFDLVMFDAPPRLSIAAANGLMASDLLLVPVKPDYLSVQPVKLMLSKLKYFKATHHARFETGGIIANLTHRSELNAPERKELSPLLQTEQVTLYSTAIPDSPAIGRPNLRPAYRTNPAEGVNPRPIFDRLAEEISRQLNLREMT